MSQVYKFYRVQLRGLSPLIMHNGQLADPMNAFTKAIKAVSSKRKKTDADLVELANLEWKGGLYADNHERLILPGRVLEAVIVKGATRSKEGKSALSGMFVETDGALAFTGSEKSIDELCADQDFRITVGVRVGQARVMRTRPILREWACSFEVSVSTKVVTNADQLRRWIADAGAFVGLGDWRPRYGRFSVEKFEEIEKEIALAA